MNRKQDGSPEKAKRSAFPAREIQADVHTSRWIIAVNLFFLIAVVAVALRWGDWRTLLSALLHINLFWVAIALVLQCGTYVCVAFAWHNVLRRLNMPIAMRSLLPLSLAKLFLDQVVPVFGLGGTALAIRGFLKRGSTDAVAVTVAAVYTLTELLINVFFLVVAFLILTADGYINPLFSVSNSLLGLSAGGVLLFAAGYAIRNTRAVRFIKNLKLVAWLIQIVYEIPRAELFDFGLWASVSLALAFVWILDAATLWALLTALGVHAPVLKILACSIVASVVAAAVVIPGGLGLFEGSSIALMSLFGIPVEHAIAASVLMRGFTYWLPMIPGFLITRREFIKSK